jgi:hypothetical protein
MANFDADTLDALRAAREIAIRTDRHPDKVVPIWVVVADDKVFVRSVYGTRGRWYRDLAESGLATLVVAGRRVPVQAVPEREAPTIDAASEAYLQKYGLSFYAQAMVKPEVLAHTLRLEPQ